MLTKTPARRCRWRDRVFDDEVDLAIEPVEEHAVDHRADRVDQEVGRDRDRSDGRGLAELVDRGGRDRVMAVSQDHARLMFHEPSLPAWTWPIDEGGPAGKQRSPTG